MTFPPRKGDTPRPAISPTSEGMFRELRAEGVLRSSGCPRAYGGLPCCRAIIGIERSPAALEGGFHEGLATAVGHRAYVGHVIDHLPQTQPSTARRPLTTQEKSATMSDQGPTGALGGGTVGPGLVVEGSGKGLKAWPGEP